MTYGCYMLARNRAIQIVGHSFLKLMMAGSTTMSPFPHSSLDEIFAV